MTQLSRFFSIMYMASNSANLLTTLVSPIIRQKVHCFDETTCFSLSFGLLGLLLVLGVTAFMFGKRVYRIHKTEHNMIVTNIKCIIHALGRKVATRKQVHKDHWMDYADDKYDLEVIEDIKATFRAFLLTVPIPVYTALFSQSISAFLFQATRMDGDVGFMTILPGQLIIFGSFSCFILVTVLDYLIYPLCARCNVVVKSMQKVGIAGVLNIMYFLMIALLQIQIEKGYPVLPVNGEAQVRLYNLLPCSVHATGFSGNGRDVLGSLETVLVTRSWKGRFGVGFKVGNCDGALEENVEISRVFEFDSDGWFGLVLRFEGKSVDVVGYRESVERSTDGHPQVR